MKLFGCAAVVLHERVSAVRRPIRAQIVTAACWTKDEPNRPAAAIKV